jgi:hypothetical protein
LKHDIGQAKCLTPQLSRLISHELASAFIQSCLV